MQNCQREDFDFYSLQFSFCNVLEAEGMRIRVIMTSDRGFKQLLGRIIERRGRREEKIEKLVRGIIRTVRQKGDRALMHYARLFDGVRLSKSAIEVKQKEMDRAMKLLPRGDLRVLSLAAKRIAAFHRHQLEKSWGYRDSLGLFLGQRITPLGRVGVYVPGGKASYPSTVLMNVIPAKVAGVGEIVMASPIGKNEAVILAAARLAGVDRLFRIGGAQAISAMAFGTETVPRVDKIVGPGNIYVAAAKRMVFGGGGIDSIAGPRESLLLAGGHAGP